MLFKSGTGINLANFIQTKTQIAGEFNPWHKLKLYNNIQTTTSIILESTMPMKSLRLEM